MSEFTIIYQCFMFLMMLVMVLTELYNLYKSINKLITPNIQQPILPPPNLHSTHNYRPVPNVNIPSSYPNVQ